MSPASQGPFPRRCLPFLSWSQRRIWLHIVFLGQGISGGCGKNVKFRIPIKYNKIIVTMRDISLVGSDMEEFRGVDGFGTSWKEQLASTYIYVSPMTIMMISTHASPFLWGSFRILDSDDPVFVFNHVSVCKEAMFANPPLVVFLVIFIILGSFGLLDSTIREMGQNPWSFVGSELHIKYSSHKRKYEDVGYPSEVGEGTNPNLRRGWVAWVMETFELKRD